MLNKSIKSNYFVTLINIAHPILLMLFVIRNFGIIAYSEIIYIVASVNLFVILLDFGVNLSLTARFKRIHKDLIKYISNTIYIVRIAIICLIVAGILFIQNIILIDFITLETLIVFTALAMNAVLPMEVYWSTKSIHKYLPILAISKIVGILLFVILVRDENLLLIYALHLFAIGLLQCFLVCFQQKTWLNFSRKIPILVYMKHSLTYFFGKSSSTYAANIPRVLLKNVASDVTYATYILYDQIYNMILNFLNPVLINILGKDEQPIVNKTLKLDKIKIKTFRSVLALDFALIVVLIFTEIGSSYYNFIDIDLGLVLLFVSLLNIKILSSVLGLPAHSILGIPVASNVDNIVSSVLVVGILNFMVLLNILSIPTGLIIIIIIELLILRMRYKRLSKHVYGH